MPAYRAPQADKAILADPPRDEWPRLAEENRRRLNAADVIVGGMPLRELRQLARSEILTDKAQGRSSLGLTAPSSCQATSPNCPTPASG